MSDERAIRAALHELSTADFPRICRCMHVIAGGGAWLTAADILSMLEALSANEAPFALGGDDFPDPRPLFRSVPGLDRVWRDAPDDIRTSFAVKLVEAGVMPVTELGDAILEQAAKDFLNDGGVELGTFAETDLLDRIARGVRPEGYTYSGAFASYFAVCSRGQAELVIRGYGSPELLTDLLAASPLDGEWMRGFAVRLAERAEERREWLSVLCVIGALVVRGEPLTTDLLRALDLALPHARDIRRADQLLTLLPEGRRSALLVAAPDWLLVRAPLDGRANLKLAEELLAGRVHGDADEGAFGAVALGGLVRLGPEGVGALLAASPELERSEPSRFLIAEAKTLQAAGSRRRTGRLACERDAAMAALFTDERASSEPWDSLWRALWPEEMAIFPPELVPQLATFDVEPPGPGRWIVAHRDHPIFAATACKDAHERMVELNAPRRLYAFYEASYTGAERRFAASPRRDELRYVVELPLGYRRTLELVRRTRVRLARTVEVSSGLLERLDVTLDEARRNGPRSNGQEPDDAALEGDDDKVVSVVSELLRLARELGRWRSRDEQSRNVEVDLVYALVAMIEQGDAPGRRAVARQWIEGWLDEDVVAAAGAFA